MAGVAAVVAGDADHGREVAAGAVAADGDPGRVAPSSAALATAQRAGPGVFDGGGEGVLGGEPVVHREDRGPGGVGEEAADPVVGLEVADHPAAAVEIDEQRRRRPARPGGT